MIEFEISLTLGSAMIFTFFTSCSIVVVVFDGRIYIVGWVLVAVILSLCYPLWPLSALWTPHLLLTFVAVVV